MSVEWSLPLAVVLVAGWCAAGLLLAAVLSLLFRGAALGEQRSPGPVAGATSSVRPPHPS